MPKLPDDKLFEFNQALIDAFTASTLEQMLLRLGRRLDRYSSPRNNIDQIVFELTTAAQREGWTPALLNAARRHVPGNDRLSAFAQQCGIAPTTPKLERRIREELPYISLPRMRSRLVELEAQVCRVEISGGAMVFGTGFLIGPEAVLTNYHVLDEVIGGHRSPVDVAFHFDYKQMFAGAPVNEGVSFKLATTDWLIDASPPSAVDDLEEPSGQLPRPDELDYALVRVAGTPGEQLLMEDKAQQGGEIAIQAPRRGWIPIPDGSIALTEGAPLFVIEHPDTAPLRVALETRSVVSLNANGTRLRHLTNTDPGSSGAPCFDTNWDLVALHHSGDPNFNPKWNEAIPIGAIRDLVRERGKADVFRDPIGA